MIALCDWLLILFKRAGCARTQGRLRSANVAYLSIVAPDRLLIRTIQPPKVSGRIVAPRRFSRRSAFRRRSSSPATIWTNETRIVREWVEARLREGVQQFFIVDHERTDGWRDEVADYIERGLITSVRASGTNNDDVRNDNPGPALASCEWLLIQDLEEFTYARQGGSIRDFLARLPVDVAQVKVPWLIFGTSENLTQPASVVQACRMREDLTAITPGRWFVKGVVRSARLLVLKIHGHKVYGRTVAPLPDLPTVDDGPYLPEAMRAREPELLLAQNH